jgi:phosphate transport system permease protein
MISTSAVAAAVAVLLAFPIGLGICCFARGLGPRPLARLTIGLVYLMTSIPTIVYAFAAATILPPLVREVFHSGSGYSLLVAVVVLAVLILPTIVLVIHGAWHGRADAVCLTGAALGLTRAQSLFRLLVPVSKPSLSMAAILGFGRAIGDTMIALLLAGNAPQMPANPLEAVRVLTAHIALVVATDAQSAAYQSVFACGVILLLTTAAVSVGARGLRRLADRGVNP